MVTQDDPLGALNDDGIESDEMGTIVLGRDKETVATQEESIAAALQEEKRNMYTVQPVLFMGHRSQTFDESNVPLSKSMHRSETMPVNTTTGSTTATAATPSSLSALGSSIKFFRYGWWPNCDTALLRRLLIIIEHCPRLSFASQHVCCSIGLIFILAMFCFFFYFMHTNPVSNTTTCFTQ